MKQLPRSALALILLASAPAGATVPAEGLEPLAVTLANAGPAPIACEAEIAHWFSAPMGAAEPGATLALDLWHDPASGVHATRNARGEFLPVERIWCGLSGNAFATRWVLPLHPDGHDATLSCAPAASGRLACR
jgi:hypothetical protein